MFSAKKGTKPISAKIFSANFLLNSIKFTGTGFENCVALTNNRQVIAFL